MAKVTAGVGALATQNKKQQLMEKSERHQTLKDLIEIRMPEIQKVLPSVVPAEQFLRLTLNAIQNTPHLKECTMSSFYGAIMQCAQLGLKPNVNGEAFLVPFKNSKKGGVYECQFMVGYKGLENLARRSGEISVIDTHEVYENDVYELEFGFEPKLVHKPCIKGDRGNVIGYYAVVLMKDGGKTAFYMTVEDAQKYGETYSKTYNKPDSPWKTAFDSMAKKTCIRQVLKHAPSSTDVDTAISRDEKVLNLDPGKQIEAGNIIDIDDEDIDEGASDQPQSNNDSDIGTDGVAVDSETGEILGGVPDAE